MSDEAKCPDCGKPKHEYWWDCPKLNQTDCFGRTKRTWRYSFRMSVKIPGTLKTK